MFVKTSRVRKLVEAQRKILAEAKSSKPFKIFKNPCVRKLAEVLRKCFCGSDCVKTMRAEAGGSFAEAVCGSRIIYRKVSITIGETAT